MTARLPQSNRSLAFQRRSTFQGSESLFPRLNALAVGTRQEENLSAGGLQHCGRSLRPVGPGSGEQECAVLQKCAVLQMQVDLAATRPVTHASCGAPGRNRTYDKRIRRPLLYPLSYRGEGVVKTPIAV